MSTSGAPLRKIVGLVKPVGLKADFACALSLASMLQISRHRGRRGVVAGPKGPRLSKVIGHLGQDEIVASPPSLSEPWAHRSANRNKLVPAMGRPTPERLGVRVLFGGIGADDLASSPDGLEALEYVQIGDGHLESRFEAALVDPASFCPDVPLAFPKSGRPCNVRFRRSIHGVSVPRSEGGRHAISVISHMIVEV